MDQDIMKIDMDQTFKDCPVCNDSDRFHAMFQTTGDRTKWLFICPACHRIFDLGFTVPQQEA
jgi:transposase-like protein